MLKSEAQKRLRGRFSAKGPIHLRHSHIAATPMLRRFSALRAELERS
ncbi:MAG: hypothetical protein MJZ45_04785 [Bacteroidales bacterium]|nr:hypothetical protein [Bacteroidales bacterium]